jgi:hypothetical protein
MVWTQMDMLSDLEKLAINYGISTADKPFLPHLIQEFELAFSRRFLLRGKKPPKKMIETAKDMRTIHDDVFWMEKQEWYDAFPYLVLPFNLWFFDRRKG